MIRGRVNEKCEPVVKLRVRGPAGVCATIEGMVDTGFTGTLTLPITTILALGLNLEFTGVAILADGTARECEYLAAILEWDDNEIPVMVSSVGDEVLIGMKLFTGHELRIEAVPGGDVRIAPIAHN